jgi:ribosomal protein L22
MPDSASAQQSVIDSIRIKNRNTRNVQQAVQSMNYQNALKQKVNMINELAKHDVTGRQQQYASSSGVA